MTGTQWVTAALKTLNAVAAEETPTAAEFADALERGNDWIDALGLEDFIIYYLLRTVVPLVNGTTSYTIGTGGAINIPRPTEISNAALILDNTAPAGTVLEVPITVFDDQQWASIAMKGMTGTYAGGIYFDHNWVTGLAKIFPLFIPNTNTTSLVIYTPQALVEMTLAGNVTFPPGYRRLMRYGLARELGPEFGGWDGAKELLYQDAKQKVQQKNLRMSDLIVDGALTGRGAYNIFNDTP